MLESPALQTLMKNQEVATKAANNRDLNAKGESDGHTVRPERDGAITDDEQSIGTIPKTI
jgi:hypothetical protein